MTEEGRLLTDEPQHEPLTRRDIVVGRNSKVWQGLARDPQLSRKIGPAIGHRQTAAFEFRPNDRVWVFSYSRDERENAALLQALHGAGVSELVYVSSSSTRVVAETNCYEYPRVKHRAELQALAHPAGKVLTIGLVYDTLDELPAGENIATSLGELAEFMQAPHWPDGQERRKYLFRSVPRPFVSGLEQASYRVYGKVIFALRRYPCLLRPIDLLLRALNVRWYGYVYLSTGLWNSTTS